MCLRRRSRWRRAVAARAWSLVGPIELGGKGETGVALKTTNARLTLAFHTLTLQTAAFAAVVLGIEVPSHLAGTLSASASRAGSLHGVDHPTYAFQFYS